MFLAGDIGGTKTVLALYEEKSNPSTPLAEENYPSTRYESLNQIVEEFLRANRPGQKRVHRAAFGVAGPIVGGTATLPNLPWVIEESKLKETFEFESAALINDLEAIGHAVPVLGSSDLATIKEGVPEQHGNIAVIAPGTGLGETFLSWDGSRYTVHPSEGGHADFAPVDQFQIGLLEYLLGHFEHVSYERVCSGTGIPNIYAYIKDSGSAEEPDWLTEELKKAEDPNAVIINVASDEKLACQICTLTAETFVSILAAEAGNMVLRHMTTGGLFLGGGIPPRILPFLRKPNFRQWFIQKGRLSRLPERVPVRVILNTKVALIGAASLVLQQAETSGQISPST
ncbi:MAG: glucokinase [Spirochaetaceae bacterium]|nr:MAG: glucokinase [Spirochaetaceae bacterium]